jgi:predicted acylesterase/phospholipase RssA
MLDQLIGKMRGASWEHGTANIVAQNIESSLWHSWKQKPTMQDLPKPTVKTASPAPAFYINATNISTGNLFLFSRRYLGDSELGFVHHPALPLSKAITASAGFPPIISPVCIQTEGATWMTNQKWHDSSHPDGEESSSQELRAGVLTPDLLDGGCGINSLPQDQREIVRQKLRSPTLFLGDGGIYDNLGLETAIRKYCTIFVSDAGKDISWNEHPARDYVLHGMAVAELVDHQVRLLRKQQLKFVYSADEAEDHFRRGTYFSIRGDVQKEWLKDGRARAAGPKFEDLRRACISLPGARTDFLAQLPTRFDQNAFTPDVVADLVNFGYLRTASALALYYQHQPNEELEIQDTYNAVAPLQLPFPDRGQIATWVRQSAAAADHQAPSH